MKIKINGTDYTSYTKIGFYLKENLDEELDDGLLILDNTNFSTPFAIMTPVYIELDNGVKKTYYCLNGKATRQSSHNALWSHQIVLLEPTKYAEKIMLPDLTFKQPKVEDTWDAYTIFTAIEAIIQVCPLRTTTSGGQFLYNTSDGKTDYTKWNTVIPEISLQQNNLREALSKIFSCINSIPRFYINDNGVLSLTCDLINDLLTPITLSDTCLCSKEIEGEYWGSEIETRLENGVQKYRTLQYPSNSWALATSTDDTPLTTDNICFKFPFPIYEIEKLEIITRVMFNGTPSWYQWKPIDITDFVVQKDTWDSLPDINNTNGGEATKGSRLYYKVGGNTIENIGTGVSRKTFLENVFGANMYPTLDFILTKTYQPDYAGATKPAYIWVSSSSSTAIQPILFRAKIKTKLDSTIRVVKEAEINTHTQVFNNQGENLIDMLDYGNNMHGVINRLANSDIEITKVCAYGEEYKMRQYTDDNFIVSNVINQYFQGFVVSVAILTKNFNQISKYIGIDSSVRQIPLPINQPIARLHYADFVTITSNVNINTSGSSANSNMITLFSDWLGGE